MTGRLPEHERYAVAVPTVSRRKIDDDMVEELVALIEAGNYMDTACAAVGISQHTLKDWVMKGRRVGVNIDLDPDDYPSDVTPEGVLPNDWAAYKIAQRITRAEAKAESYAVLIVRKHMPDQWTAAMTFLERRYPARWRRRMTTEHVDGGQVIDGGLDEQAMLSDPEAVSLLHDALERVALPPGSDDVVIPASSDTPTSDTPTSDTPTSDTPTSDTPTSDAPPRASDL